MRYVEQKEDIMRYFGLLMCCACGTMNTARPLDKGQTAVGLTLGGPMVEFGGSFVPLPNAVVEGRTGMKPLNGKNWDINYGLNLTALALTRLECILVPPISS